MAKVKGTRSGDNGNYHKRKFNWLQYLWIPILMILIGGGSVMGYKLTRESQAGTCTVGTENKHRLDMLEQKTNIELKNMQDQLTRIENKLDNIVK